MTEQQEQLKKILERKAEAMREYQKGEKQLAQLRDLILKLEGAVEGLEIIGVRLDEEVERD